MSTTPAATSTAPVTASTGTGQFKSKVSYTVTVNAPNGTHDQTVTITDRLAAENTANGSYDTSSIKIDGKPLSEYTDAAITYNTDGKGFTITGLPPLGYNQSYELTYDVTGLLSGRYQPGVSVQSGHNGAECYHKRKEQ